MRCLTPYAAETPTLSDLIPLNLATARKKELLDRTDEEATRKNHDADLHWSAEHGHFGNGGLQYSIPKRHKYTSYDIRNLYT